MAINGSLDGLKKDVMKNLSKDKLKQFIFYLTKKYYESFKDNDVDAYDIAIEQLYFVIEEYGDKYVNLNGFVCYCLYLNANVEVMKNHDQQAFPLDPLFKMDLLNEDVEELGHDIKNIFNKERIKERYYEKRTRELIE